VTKDYVRMELQGANLIQPRPEGGILYTYIQHVRLACCVVSHVVESCHTLVSCVLCAVMWCAVMWCASMYGRVHVVWC
jgi:hypothetical protein